MAFLKNGSKPIAKRSKRRVYKLKSTLGEYKVQKNEYDSKQKFPIQMNQGNEDSMSEGPYRMNDDGEAGIFEKK